MLGGDLELSLFFFHVSKWVGNKHPDLQLSTPWKVRYTMENNLLKVLWLIDRVRVNPVLVRKWFYYTETCGHWKNRKKILQSSVGLRSLIAPDAAELVSQNYPPKPVEAMQQLLMLYSDEYITWLTGCEFLQWQMAPLCSFKKATKKEKGLFYCVFDVFWFFIFTGNTCKIIVNNEIFVCGRKPGLNCTFSPCFF